MTSRVTIAAKSRPVPELVLSPDAARKLGQLLIAEAAEYEFPTPDRAPTTGTAAVKVTVTEVDSDVVLGERVLDNDFMIITAGNRELAHVSAYGNGTQVATIKVVGS